MEGDVAARSLSRCQPCPLPWSWLVAGERRGENIQCLKGRRGGRGGARGDEGWTREDKGRMRGGRGGARGDEGWTREDKGRMRGGRGEGEGRMRGGREEDEERIT